MFNLIAAILLAFACGISLACASYTPPSRTRNGFIFAAVGGVLGTVLNAIVVYLKLTGLMP